MPIRSEAISVAGGGKTSIFSSDSTRDCRWKVGVCQWMEDFSVAVQKSCDDNDEIQLSQLLSTE